MVKLESEEYLLKISQTSTEGTALDFYTLSDTATSAWSESVCDDISDCGDYDDCDGNGGSGAPDPCPKI